MERPWCVDERCGVPQGHAGRLPNGWVTVKLAGEDAPRRFCGPRHAGLALLSVIHGRPVDHIDKPDHAMPELLATVNELAHTHLTVLTATPRRVRAALDRAACRVLADLDAWQARQDRRRPGVRELLGEATSGQPADPDEMDPEDDQPMAEEATGP